MNVWNQAHVSYHIISYHAQHCQISIVCVLFILLASITFESVQLFLISFGLFFFFILFFLFFLFFFIFYFFLFLFLFLLVLCFLEAWKRHSLYFFHGDVFVALWNKWLATPRNLRRDHLNVCIHIHTDTHTQTHTHTHTHTHVHGFMCDCTLSQPIEQSIHQLLNHIVLHVPSNFIRVIDPACFKFFFFFFFFPVSSFNSYSRGKHEY